MKKVMAVDDSIDFLELVNKRLANKYHVYPISDPLNLLEKVLEVLPDVILLDINFDSSSFNGLDLCAQIKNHPDLYHIPIILLTNVNEPHKKAMGFQLGAADYVVKPFEPVELMARIEARLKDSVLQNTASILKSGCIRLDLVLQSAKVSTTKETRELALTSTEFRLLSLFLENENTALTRKNIIHQVWGDKITISERTVDVHISALKKKHSIIDKSIKSVYGTGYKYVRYGLDEK